MAPRLRKIAQLSKACGCLSFELYEYAMSSYVAKKYGYTKNDELVWRQKLRDDYLPKIQQFFDGVSALLQRLSKLHFKESPDEEMRLNKLMQELGEEMIRKCGLDDDLFSRLYDYCERRSQLYLTLQAVHI